jgi:leader peptidase (prepilin peptidase)/N-methyltransferase
MLGGLWSFALLAARRGTLKSAIPFGPFMLAGTAAAMLLLPAG